MNNHTWGNWVTGAREEKNTHTVHNPDNIALFMYIVSVYLLCILCITVCFLCISYVCSVYCVNVYIVIHVQWGNKLGFTLF